MCLGDAEQAGYMKTVGKTMLKVGNYSPEMKGLFDKAMGEGDLTSPNDGPPAPPDLTDEAVRKARARRMMQTLMGRGRAGSFLTGPSSFANTSASAQNQFASQL